MKLKASWEEFGDLPCVHVLCSNTKSKTLFDLAALGKSVIAAEEKQSHSEAEEMSVWYGGVCVFVMWVGNGQVRPDPEKLKAVKSFPVPLTKKEVRGFLGLIYRRFINNYASEAIPLIDLTKKSLPDKVV